MHVPTRAFRLWSNPTKQENDMFQFDGGTSTGDGVVDTVTAVTGSIPSILNLLMLIWQIRTSRKNQRMIQKVQQEQSQVAQELKAKNGG